MIIYLEIKYVITHGQLSPKLLESRISKFYNQEVPLMLSYKYY